MRFAQIDYVMGTHDYPAQRIVTVYDHGQLVTTVRLYESDYDRTPAFDGAEEDAWNVAEMLVGPGGKIHMDDVSIADIIAGEVPGYDV